MKILLLIFLALASTQQEETECGDDVTSNNGICNELFLKFQQAIVSNEANLYSLRKDFFPSSKPPPTLLNVSFEVSFSNTSQVPCSNTDNETVGPQDVFRDNRGWTSQSLYTQIHPVVINRLQPQIIYLMMIAFEPKSPTSGKIEASLAWQGLKGQTFLTLHLYLDVNGLSCLPTVKQVQNTLDDLTSVVRSMFVCLVS